MSVNVLPDSRARISRGEVSGPGGVYEQCYCANCGCLGPQVLKENCTFACWLCAKCEETYGAIAGTYRVPDEVFFKKCEEAQQETYHRVLSPEELLRELDKPRSVVSQLARDRKIK